MNCRESRLICFPLHNVSLEYSLWVESLYSCQFWIPVTVVHHQSHIMALVVKFKYLGLVEPDHDALANGQDSLL